jgi:hypothetical protein
MDQPFDCFYNGSTARQKNEQSDWSAPKHWPIENRIIEDVSWLQQNGQRASSRIYKHIYSYIESNHLNMFSVSPRSLLRQTTCTFGTCTRDRSLVVPRQGVSVSAGQFDLFRFILRNLAAFTLACIVIEVPGVHGSGSAVPWKATKVFWNLVVVCKLASLRNLEGRPGAVLSSSSFLRFVASNDFSRFYSIYALEFSRFAK